MAVSRPNILCVLADDWGRYASAYARHEGPTSLNGLIKTPYFDRIASEGVLFLNAFAPSPGCNPSRNSLLTGRYFWQTGRGAIEQGATWDAGITTFPLELEKEGYHIGYSYEVTAKTQNAPFGGDRTGFQGSGQEFNSFSLWVTKEGPKIGIAAAKEVMFSEVRGNFRSFLDKRPKSQPFCYWWGACTTHREFAPGSGKELWGIDPDSLRGRMPTFFPDVHAVREDMADYLGECMALDGGLGVLLHELEARGELTNTLVVVSGDNGAPGMPRAKGNLYDAGCQVCLAACWPSRIPGGRIVSDFVNLMDLAPTFCEVAGVPIPATMSARSLLPLLTSGLNGQVEPGRDFVVAGRERHVSMARAGFLPYPQRSLRTKEFLYIINFEPSRWPMGDPYSLDDLSIEVPDDSITAFKHDTMVVFPDCDAGPTKAWVIQHRMTSTVEPCFQLWFGKRPSEELYDLQVDPHQMNNVAGKLPYAEVRRQLEQRLRSILVAQRDPRLVEHPCRFELEPFAAIDDKYISPKGAAFLEGLRRSRNKWERPKAKL